MANYQRNDPSSLSFGRRMQALETHVVNQAKQIDDLKAGQLTSQEKQSAKELAAAKKDERNRANQMLASYGTTIDDLDSLNQSLLSSAQREQLRHHRNSLQAAQLNGPLVQFDDDALARLDNWKKMSALNPVQADFTKNNVMPGGQKPQRPYDIWKSRQDSPQGRYERNKRHQQSLERDVMVRRAEMNRNKPQPKGINLGNIRPLDE